jgi:sporulation protein YlmC with PRC-barrel domain
MAFYAGRTAAVQAVGKVVGERVRLRAGDKLGKIEEVMVDAEEGRLSYAVISLDCSLGFGEKLFAIPWTLLEIDPDGKGFLLEMDRQTLEEAPGFNRSQWPHKVSREWLTGLYEYFRIPAYWY